MPTVEIPLRVSNHTKEEFEARLAEFIPALDAYVADYYKKTHGDALKPPTHTLDRGPKYIRVVQVGISQRSAYAFLDYEGTIYKAHGWGGPARKVPTRGSIFDENFSLGKGLTPYGTVYLK